MFNYLQQNHFNLPHMLRLYFHWPGHQHHNQLNDVFNQMEDNINDLIHFENTNTSFNT